MLLIIGLGNPGKTYERTRHNMGFSAIDLFASKIGCSIDKKGFQGLYQKLVYHNQELLLLKPQTFMNLSGQSVQEIVNFYKISTDNIIVIYDDLDLPPGKIRLREKGSSGGHKGMQSIIDHLSTDEIKRIKIGIGHSLYSVVDYVLGKPDSEDQAQIDIALTKIKDIVDEIILHDFKHASSKYN